MSFLVWKKKMDPRRQQTRGRGRRGAPLRLVLDGLLRGRVREAERARAVDVDAGERGVEDRGEE